MSEFDGADRRMEEDRRKKYGFSGPNGTQLRVSTEDRRGEVRRANELKQLRQKQDTLYYRLTQWAEALRQKRRSTSSEMDRAMLAARQLDVEDHIAELEREGLITPPTKK